MKVLVALIDDMETAQAAAGSLFPAMTGGRIKEARACEEKLLGSIFAETAISLDESEWDALLSGIRRTRPDFKAGYILASGQSRALQADKGAMPDKVARLVERSCAEDKALLFLPMEGDPDER